jgi:radical SAM superfamily enzyme YgiQ (UPF0313 family)
MIRFSVNIMRGCFGGCSFCSITEHEGRIIQSRSEKSILREVEEIRDRVEGFTGVISDLGGPTANMYRLACKDPEIESQLPAAVLCLPGYLQEPEHRPLGSDRPVPQGARAAGHQEGADRIRAALRPGGGIPEYVRELVTHHVGGYLKIAPEHTEEGPLSRMMKPGMGTYDRFKAMFDRFSREAGRSST